ncbi:MAG: M48 family metallopeptidase [Agathobacter sp.]|nr:M48 family metallopeptidase [Agathobacter sp.]
MQLTYNNEIIQIHIERSKRKTMSMSVNKDGSVMVKAPLRYPSDQDIQNFVEQKIDWIVKQRDRQQEREDMKLVRRFETDYSFPYLGEERLVEMQSGKKTSISYENGKIIIKTPFCEALEKNYEADENKKTLEKLQSDLKKWYKKQAYSYISKRVEYYQRIVGVTVTEVSIKSRKSQWGSCDSNGCLTFSWRLVMARPEAIDYVVIHELCHRKYMDHSRDFWNQVQKYMPDFKEQKQWLEENSVNLNIE